VCMNFHASCSSNQIKNSFGGFSCAAFCQGSLLVFAASNFQAWVPSPGGMSIVRVS
jgi:hypothetical protein